MTSGQYRRLHQRQQPEPGATAVVVNNAAFQWPFTSSGSGGADDQQRTSPPPHRTTPWHRLVKPADIQKGKRSPYSSTERTVPELIPVLGSQPAGDVSHKPGGRPPLLSARPAVAPATLKRAAYCYQFCCLVNRGTMGANSLPKTVTRQRRGCDLNPGPSAPESSTLTTRLPSHPEKEPIFFCVHLFLVLDRNRQTFATG